MLSPATLTTPSLHLDLCSLHHAHQAELQTLYSWVDEVPLSRPKRNIARDFSDGVLVAELVAHYFPSMVELHNYSSANSAQQKGAHAHAYARDLCSPLPRSPRPRSRPVLAPATLTTPTLATFRRPALPLPRSPPVPPLPRSRRPGYNWATLNSKVFRKLGFHVDQSDVQDVCTSKPGAIERALLDLRAKLATYKPRRGGGGAVPSRGARPPPGPRGPGQGATAGGARSVAAPAHTAPSGGMQQQVDAELLIEKEQDIQELRETVEILEFKVQKLEQLVRLKDAKIQTLTQAQQ